MDFDSVMYLWQADLCEIVEFKKTDAGVSWGFEEVR